MSKPPPSNSLKREMHAVSEEFGLQPVTTAMAFVYFEKLVLQGRLNKQNRKLVAAACVLLAAKISSDLRKPEVKQLIDVSPPFPSHESQLSPFSVFLNLNGVDSTTNICSGLNTASLEELLCHVTASAYLHNSCAVRRRTVPPLNSSGIDLFVLTWVCVTQIKSESCCVPVRNVCSVVSSKKSTGPGFHVM